MKYGFYHYSWVAPGNQKQHQQNALTRTAGRGCTLLHLSHLGDVAHTRKLLKLAEGRGMTLIIEDLIGADLKALEGTPNLIHSVRDDANVKPLAEVQAACKASETARRYLSIGPGLKDNCAALYGLTEAVGVQSYVYGYGETLWASWLVWRAARTQGDLNKTQVWANAQLHRLEKHHALPAPEQITAQLWVAAACGLDGVLGYTLIDTMGSLPTALEQHFCAVMADIPRLAPGRPLATDVKRDVLTATWAGGVEVRVDLKRAAVLSVRRRG